jgi:hypothetical protein
MNEYLFNCVGGFDVGTECKVGRNYVGDVVCFHLPDGRTVDLFVGLRVVNPDGTEDYYYSDSEFESLGFYNQEYDRMEFKASNYLNQNDDYAEQM